eukprot:350551-Chlamydomonas_euryale.AAC.4
MRGSGTSNPATKPHHDRRERQTRRKKRPRVVEGRVHARCAIGHKVLQGARPGAADVHSRAGVCVSWSQGRHLESGQAPGWPPGWSLCKLESGHAPGVRAGTWLATRLELAPRRCLILLNRMRLCYPLARSSLIVCKSMRRSCKSGWDGWMGGKADAAQEVR